MILRLCFVETQNLTCPCVHLETLLQSLYSILVYLLSMCFKNDMKNLDKDDATLLHSE